MRTASDTLALVQRNLRRIPRSPDLLLGFTIQPIMFVLLFVYVFGGAIQTPGFGSYKDFLIPGICVQMLAFGALLTGIGLADDLHKGLIDRFRSLPIARSAVLAGRTLSDVVTNVFQLVVLLVVGYIIGFRFGGTVAAVLAGTALALLFAFAISWISALTGLLVRSVEAAQQSGFIWVFPLTFVSSAFVPVDSMPDGLRQFAEVNPFTLTVDAVRALYLGQPAGNDAWWSLLWSVGLIAVFAPLAVSRYRRVAAGA
jgi:ABC-2 type transport system permease protein/oleandomycin transport system permease protein